MMQGPKRPGLSPYMAREPVTVALLTALTIVLFLAVIGLSSAYRMRVRSLANRWSARGEADLRAERFTPAVTDFQSALLYSRDNYSYQLHLAEALIGLHRTGEAQAYLMNLWSLQPENGRVNLELARIAAEKGETRQALRFYHNAIYATWPDDEETERQEAHWELIEYLLRINANTQAQSELIALAANMGDDSAKQARLGKLFFAAQDYEHALAAYRLSLKADRHNALALAGAGLSAFELSRYPIAQRYLQAAAEAAPGDVQSAAALHTTELVLQMDPYRQQVSAAQRDRIVAAAFIAAGARLKPCLAPGAVTPPQPLKNLAQEWAKLKPRITGRGLRQDPDLVDAAMKLVFDIERQSNGECGPPSETDTALLLIAKLHEEN